MQLALINDDGKPFDRRTTVPLNVQMPVKSVFLALFATFCEANPCNTVFAIAVTLQMIDFKAIRCNIWIC